MHLTCSEQCLAHVVSVSHYDYFITTVIIIDSVVIFIIIGVLPYNPDNPGWWFLTEIFIASALQEEKWPRADEIRCFSYDYGLGGNQIIKCNPPDRKSFV